MAMSEFAPEYSKKEKLLILLKHAVWVVPLFVATQYLFFPRFVEFADRSHCYQYVGIYGTEIMFYGLIVGLPLIFSLLILLFEGARSVTIIRLGQSPLPNEKVFKPTQYSYGSRARIKPIFVLLIVVFLIGFSVRGWFSVQQLINNLDLTNLPECSQELKF